MFSNTCIAEKARNLGYVDLSPVAFDILFDKGTSIKCSIGF